MTRLSVQTSLGGYVMLAAVLLSPAVVFAQAYPAVQQPKKQDFHASGEYEGASNGLIKAVLDGKPWLLKGDKDVKLHMTGSATADYLHPGLFVKFKAEVDRRGKATAPITDLVIFTPDQKNPIGATTAGNGFDEQNKKAPNATTAYDCAGRITGMNKTGTTINCGNITVKAEIAPEATIKIDIQDLQQVQPSSGDKIAVKGWFQREGQGVVNEVTIELANPLTGPKKKTHGVAKPADKPDATATPDTKKDAPKPDATKPDAKSGAKPDATKGAAKPDAAKPDAAKPDPAKPDAAKPDAAK